MELLQESRMIRYQVGLILNGLQPLKKAKIYKEIVFLGGLPVVVEQQKIFLMALICTTNIKIPFTQGLQFLKEGLGLFHFFRLKLRILQKLLKIFRNTKHVCFNALIKRPLYYDGRDKLHELTAR